MTATGWSESVGLSPHAVLVFEHVGRKGIVYLRWWDRTRGNWKVQSLRRPLVPATDGKAPKGRDLARATEEGKTWARGQAMQQYLRLSGQVKDDAPPRAPARPLGILAGLARATDAATGAYLTDTPYRRDIEAAVRRAALVWGDDYPWNGVRRAQWEQFWRTVIRDVRAKGGAGLSAARHAVERVHAVAAWLRGRELVESGAGVLWPKWKDDVARDYTQISGDALPEPHRPRYTTDELRALLAAARQVEPRLDLLLAVGAELRPAQVLRARRSDLVLDAVPAAPFGALRIKGRGKKAGVLVALTRGQRAAVDHALGVAQPGVGVLRLLEQRHQADGTDYRLFPGGMLTARGRWTKAHGSQTVPPVAQLAQGATHISVGRARAWFKVAERAAGIPPLKGRALYGTRRTGVDAATTLGVSPEALMQLGGWADTRTPEQVYRDQALVQGRDEARAIRAAIRGEVAEADAPDTHRKRTVTKTLTRAWPLSRPTAQGDTLQ